MKHMIIIVATVFTITACSDSKPEVENNASARQSTIDSMKMQSELQLTRQRIIDSVNLINAQNNVIVNSIEPSPTYHTTHKSHGNAVKNPIVTNPATNSSDHTAVNNNTSTASTPEEKKKMSGKTKGAIIGAAAGIITGAAAGAIINKENPVQGGIIGGAIGGAVGSGVGYGGGNAADNKKAKQDSIDRANPKP
jgi:hypothetical protein